LLLINVNVSIFVGSLSVGLRSRLDFYILVGPKFKIFIIKKLMYSLFYVFNYTDSNITLSLMF
jgi:hypothetical protein